MRARTATVLALACLGLLSGTTSGAAASPWARHAAVESAADCTADPSRPVLLGPLMGPWSGRTPPVKVGMWWALIDPDRTAHQRESVAILATEEQRSAVIGCIDIPPDWDRSGPIEVELQARSVPTLAGRARLAPVDASIIEIVLVTWGSAGIAPTSDTVICDDLGTPEDLSVALADVGLTEGWSVVTPDGTPVRVAWSEQGRMTAAIVGEDPVRSLAVQGRYDADSTIRGGWDADTLGQSFVMLRALSDRWAPRLEPGPERWPTVWIFETQRVVVTRDVEIDEQGLFVGLQVEPKAMPRGCES